MENLRPAEVFPPGEFLKDELEFRAWTQTDLAEIMGRHVSVINEILSAKRGLTAETAQALGDALGGRAQFWLNLESAFRLSLIKKDDVVARRARLYSKAPVREMIRRGWIEASFSIKVLERAVLDFLGIPDLGSDSRFAHAARKSTSYDEPPSPPQIAWLCRARQLASAVRVEEFSRNRVPQLVDDLRGLAEAPENVGLVPKVLARYGIRFLMIEALAGTKIDGATFLMDATPVIVLSLRFDRIDHFWHTLMHEVAHIWFDDGTMIDENIVNEGAHLGDADAIEQRANAYAATSLIPRERLLDFVIRVRPLFSAVRIQNFARTMEVHAGIVVGQLQHMHEIGYQNLRKMLVPVRGVITRTALTDGWGSQLPNRFT
jgi:HTH-type transcriptional regulator/antitoxin HigA